MKTKLQALIAEQKALTAKFEELLNETTIKPYAFVGNKDRAEEIKKYFNNFSSDDCIGAEFVFWKNKAGDICRVYKGQNVFELIQKTHTIIDLNVQPDFFDKLENTNTDPEKVFIKGHPTRGAEVIKMLEDLGGVNKYPFAGTNSDVGYYIQKDGFIDYNILHNLSDYTELHLPKRN